jgi:DNA-binding transcriptional regulator YdaS (Cro superfamily)
MLKLKAIKRGCAMNTHDVAEFFGSKKKLAAALGIHPSAVTMWGETIPESRQYQIQVLSKGKFKAERKPKAA